MNISPEQSYINLDKTPRSFKPIDIISYKPVITQIDRDRGEIIRYFCRQSNHLAPTGIKEISKEKYNELKNNSLYSTVEVRWIIKGPISDLTTNDGSSIIREGVESLNKKSVLLASKTLSGLDTIIIDYLRFWQSP